MISSWNVGPWEVQLLPDTGEFRGPVPPPGTHVGTLVRAADHTEPYPAGGFVITPSDRAAVRTADCMPFIVASDTRAAILHISRKSLLDAILENIEEHIPSNVIKYAWIGPHICEHHFGFEYEGEEISRFIELYPEAVHREGDMLYLSLRKVVTRWLEQKAGSSVTILDTNICTYESGLPSWRRWQEEHGSVQPFPQFISILQAQQRTAG